MTRAQWEATARAEAQRHGIDPELVLRVIQTESSWNPKAGSPKGALGLMQITPITAKDMGANAVPMDPHENIRMGVGYLAKMLKRFDGDVAHALAAYNWGPTALSKHGIGSAPAETRNYITKIMGAPAPATSQRGEPGMNQDDAIAAARKRILSRINKAPSPAQPADAVTAQPTPAQPTQPDAPSLAQRVYNVSPQLQFARAAQEGALHAIPNLVRAGAGELGFDGTADAIAQGQQRVRGAMDAVLPQRTGGVAEKVGQITGDVVAGAIPGAGVGGVMMGGAKVLGKLPGMSGRVKDIANTLSNVLYKSGQSVATGGVANPAQNLGRGMMERGAAYAGRGVAGAANAGLGGMAVSGDTKSTAADMALGGALPLTGGALRNTGQMLYNRYLYDPRDPASQVLRSSLTPGTTPQDVRANMNIAGQRRTIAPEMPYIQSGNYGLYGLANHMNSADQNFAAALAQARKERADQWFARLRQQGMGQDKVAEAVQARENMIAPLRGPMEAELSRVASLTPVANTRAPIALDPRAKTGTVAGGLRSYDDYWQRVADERNMPGNVYFDETQPPGMQLGVRGRAPNVGAPQHGQLVGTSVGALHTGAQELNDIRRGVYANTPLSSATTANDSALLDFTGQLRDAHHRAIDRASPAHRPFREAYKKGSVDVNNARTLTKFGERVTKYGEDLPASPGVLNELRGLLGGKNRQDLASLTPETQSLLHTLRGELGRDKRTRGAFSRVTPNVHSLIVKGSEHNPAQRMAIGQMAGPRAGIAMTLADAVLGTTKRSDEVRSLITDALLRDPNKLRELMERPDARLVLTDALTTVMRHGAQRAVPAASGERARAERQ